MLKKRGTILMETAISLGVISILIVPIFSQNNFYLRFLRENTIEEGEEIVAGSLKGIGMEDDITVEIEYLEDGSYYVTTDRKYGVCR
ncbi:MAG: hypothetical protein ACRC0G_17750 [Fusobacteriaceae bacterium]